MEKYHELARCVENIEKDASKFFINGNKAAGTRARKHLQELKKLAQELRVVIQEVKNDKSQTPAEVEHDEHDGDGDGEMINNPDQQHLQMHDPHHEQQHLHDVQDHENAHAMAYANHPEPVVKYEEEQQQQHHQHDPNNLSF